MVLPMKNASLSGSAVHSFRLCVLAAAITQLLAASRQQPARERHTTREQQVRSPGLTRSGLALLHACLRQRRTPRPQRQRCCCTAAAVDSRRLPPPAARARRQLSRGAPRPLPAQELLNARQPWRARRMRSMCRRTWTRRRSCRPPTAPTRTPPTCRAPPPVRAWAAAASAAAGWPACCACLSVRAPAHGRRPRTPRPTDQARRFARALPSPA